MRIYFHTHPHHTHTRKLIAEGVGQPTILPTTAPVGIAASIRVDSLDPGAAYTVELDERDLGALNNRLALSPCNPSTPTN